MEKRDIAKVVLVVTAWAVVSLGPIIGLTWVVIHFLRKWW